MTESHKAKNCFAIMPISDPDGYDHGHFKRVFDDIISPACSNAGYKAVRADDVKQTNLIHLDILLQLIDAPIAICDLSSRNPNVLFELGIRQAFDKPVVLIQEIGTPKIFDIAPLRCLEYDREMKYRSVLQAQKDLKESIEATVASEKDPQNANSIVKLLSLNSAKIPDLKPSNKNELAIELIQSEVREVKDTLQKLVRANENQAERKYTIRQGVASDDSTFFDRLLQLADNKGIFSEAEKKIDANKLSNDEFQKIMRSRFNRNTQKN